MSASTKGLRPTHPGEVLREIVLPSLGKSRVEIARLLGVSRQTLYAILNERQPITRPWHCASASCAATAPNLGNMQQAYDLEIAAKELAGEIKKIPTLTAA